MTEGEREIRLTDLEWDYLGRLPLDSKLDGLLIQRGMVQNNQFLDQRLTEVLTRLDQQPEVISGRVKSIILSRIENEREGSADVYVTKVDIEKVEKGLLLVPEKRLPSKKESPKFSQEEIYRTLTEDNGLFFVVDEH